MSLKVLVPWRIWGGSGGDPAQVRCSVQVEPASDNERFWKIYGFVWIHRPIQGICPATGMDKMFHTIKEARKAVEIKLKEEGFYLL